MNNYQNLESEVLEQARLLSMGSEREAKLLSKVDSLLREKEKLQRDVNNLRSMYNNLIDLKDALENRIKSLEKV